MIDWISGTLPFSHRHVIGEGFHIDMDRNGDVKRQILKRREITGSFETGINVRTDLCSEREDGTYSHLKFDGNPVKLFQGHNLWGSNDLHGPSRRPCAPSTDSILDSISTALVEVQLFRM